MNDNQADHSNPAQKPQVGSLAAHVRILLADLCLHDLIGDVRSPGYPNRIGNYQYTAHGRLFFSCDPRAEEVYIDDIARHLSRICRFGGANKRWMSVAEHCWICSHEVPPQFALEALLHDAAEAYINDLIRPLKKLPVFGDIYLKIEAPIERAIAKRYNLTYPWPAAVKKVDEFVCGVEVAQNIASTVVNHLTEDIESREAGAKSGMQLYHWEPALAEQYFLQRFNQLTRERAVAA